MNIDYFSEFLTLVETQNFGLTAQQHYISIAALSRHMRSLEAQFNTVLFQRRGSKTNLTDAGKMMIPYAQTIIAARDGFQETVTSISDRPNLEISIATNIPLSFYGITDLIEKFQREHRISRINVSSVPVQQVEKGLLTGVYDFAIVWHLENQPYHLTAIPLQKIELAALLPVTHRLASKSTLQISDLNGEPILLLDNSSAFYSRVILLCQEAGFAPFVRATAHRGRSIEDLVCGGFGLGLLPVADSVNLRQDVVRRPIWPCFEIAQDLIYNPDELSECAGALMQYLSNRFSDSVNLEDI